MFRVYAQSAASQSCHQARSFGFSGSTLVGGRHQQRVPRQTHKVDADGRDVALGVCVVGKTEEQARLSDTRVSDEEKLEEIVVSIVPRSVSGLSVLAGTAASRLGCKARGALYNNSSQHGSMLGYICRRLSGCGGGLRTEVDIPLGVHGCGVTGGMAKVRVGRRGLRKKRLSRGLTVGYRAVSSWVDEVEDDEVVSTQHGGIMRGHQVLGTAPSQVAGTSYSQQPDHRPSLA